MDTAATTAAATTVAVDMAADAATKAIKADAEATALVSTNHRLLIEAEIIVFIIG